MRGVIQIRALLAAALAGLLLAGTPAARADDLPQAPVSAQDIVTQAVAAATAPAAPEPAPVPEQPAAAPAPAPAPAEEPAAAATEPVAAPEAPTPPANLNVSVRIGSEGDDAPVSQTSPGTNVNVSVRVDSPGASGTVEQVRPAAPKAPVPVTQAGDDAAPTVVFHWTWTSACGRSARAAVELDWHWSCDAPVTGVAAPVVPVLPPLPPLPSDAAPGAVPLAPALPAPVVPVVSFPRFGTTAPPVASTLAPSALTLAPRDLAMLDAVAASEPAAISVPLANRSASPPAAVPRRSPSDRKRPSKRPDPAPISPEIPLPPVALVTTSPAGSSTGGAFFLLALALLAAAALSGPSGPRLRLRAATNRLRARAGRRLERPG